MMIMALVNNNSQVNLNAKRLYPVLECLKAKCTQILTKLNKKNSFSIHLEEEQTHFLYLHLDTKKGH